MEFEAEKEGDARTGEQARTRRSEVGITPRNGEECRRTPVTDVVCSSHAGAQTAGVRGQHRRRRRYCASAAPQLRRRVLCLRTTCCSADSSLDAALSHQTQGKILLANYALTYWILRRRRAAFQEIEEPEAEPGAKAGAKTA